MVVVILLPWRKCCACITVYKDYLVKIEAMVRKLLVQERRWQNDLSSKELWFNELVAFDHSIVGLKKCPAQQRQTSNDQDPLSSLQLGAQALTQRILLQTEREVAGSPSAPVVLDSVVDKGEPISLVV